MKYYVIDAFTDAVFGGNPAGVCVLDAPIDAALMQKIAFENNLADTAFLLPEGNAYRLRWFTPLVEVDLCGHATLASAYVVTRFLKPGSRSVTFHTNQSGTLSAACEDDRIVLDFPSRKAVPCAPPQGLAQALGVEILETHQSRDTIVLVQSAAAVAAMRPDFEKLKQYTDTFAFCVTARGEETDFVSRFFAPNTVVDEDPVTGSSHTTLIPFWSERLHKTKMTAAQLSRRGGVLFCEDCGERVKIGGTAVCYLEGELLL
jgi:PhzF family phenazine biosynthesis protein